MDFSPREQSNLADHDGFHDTAQGIAAGKSDKAHALMETRRRGFDSRQGFQVV